MQLTCRFNQAFEFKCLAKSEINFIPRVCMRHRTISASARFASVILVGASFLVPASFGQTSVQSATARSGPEGFSGTASFSDPMPMAARGIVNAPYSADQVIEQVQTLADGTHITRKGAVQKMYRDSLGRTRTERPVFGGMALSGRIPDSPTVVEITDPVAKVKYTLDTVNRVAHRQQLRALPNQGARTATSTATAGEVGVGRLGGGGGSASAIPSAAVVASPPTPNAIARPTISQDKLGTQTIEGVLVEGTRITSTYAVDTEGNDRPIVVVNETWMSPALKVMIMNRSSDPRSGERTQKLTNITQGEPAAELFLPPSDYSVVDETGPFTLRWGSPR
jgi:hypothetical protein